MGTARTRSRTTTAATTTSGISGTSGSKNKNNNVDKNSDSLKTSPKTGRSVERAKSIEAPNSRGLLKNGSFTSLFKKRTRADLEAADNDNATDNNRVISESDGSDGDDGIRPKSNKKQKTKSSEEMKFLENEKKLDELLPEDLRKYRPKGFKFNLPPKNRPIRIYADGVFDLFHLGHMRQLEQCKKAFPNVTLVCGVPSDVETHKRKGLTVLTDVQRCETLKHCRWVDEVIPNAPWCVTPEFLQEHKIDYVAHDDLPYASTDSDDIYRPMKMKGMFLTTQRTGGISTSDIITKIIRDYDKYLMRNFARGATRKELNVSWLKKNELEFKKHINDFRGYWKKTNENLNNASKDLYFEVREYLRGSNKLLSPSSTSTFTALKRTRSPATDFASKYNGNLRRSDSGRSFIDNFKDWMKKNDDAENSSSFASGEESNEDHKEQDDHNDANDDEEEEEEEEDNLYGYHSSEDERTLASAHEAQEQKKGEESEHKKRKTNNKHK